MEPKREFKVGVDVGENDVEPAGLVKCAILAEKMGFDSVWFGDHFMPWIHTGGKSAFIWSLLASSLEKTTRIAMGPDVTCPIGGRFHPAIVAQAAATLDSMYPGRLKLGVGSGEAVNEARFFYEQLGHWPRWNERIQRLCEGVELMRRLWNSQEYFTFEGQYFKMTNVFQYTKPQTEIPIYFSAIGAKAATYAGKFGDHLITVSSPERCKEIVFPNFARGVREEGKDLDRAEKMVLVGLMIGEPEENMRRLKPGMAGWLAKGAFDEPDPRVVEASAEDVDDDLIREYYQFCASVDDLVEVAHRYVQVGADHVVFATGASLELIKSIGERVLPSLRDLV